ncbi:MAG: RluA family pseudouridine synthase, partial [Clostridia bacterium]|nr:RluA family pseudouridine synthase [Clostridia bacterium]
QLLVILILMEIEFKVTQKEHGSTVNHILKDLMNLSARQIQRMKNNDGMFLNHQRCIVKDVVYENDVVTVILKEHRISNEIISSNMMLDILFEDDYIISLDKPKGAPVHPVGKYIENTLSNGLKYYFEQKGINMVARPIGRLDRDTTGVILFAKNSHVHTMMVKALNADDSSKKYVAVTVKAPDCDEGIIDMGIKRSADSIISRITAEDGKRSLTRYKVLERYSKGALIEFELLTGRTHQIRVHCQAFGIPVFGDTLYGTASALIDRQALHCRETSFIHPFSKEKISIEAPLPSDMQYLIDELKKH